MIHKFYSKTISLFCPHCNSQCQFIEIDHTTTKCTENNRANIYYICSNCGGGILTYWIIDRGYGFNEKNHFILEGYLPKITEYTQKTDLKLINNENVKNDFIEAINCYNNGLYNACMMMTRRCIQQEMMSKKIDQKLNLYEQIESVSTSQNLKQLLQKVKNFGNHGAHPDFCLFNGNGEEIENKKEFAKLSLDFLDRFFADEYELKNLIDNAPKSKKEMENVVKESK